MFTRNFGACCTPSFFSHRVHRSCLKPGDHVYVWSSFLHHHHAVYVGDGPEVGNKQSVIHVYGDNKLASTIRLDSLNQFATGRMIRRARYGVKWWQLYLKPPGTAFGFPADPPEVIVQRAWRWLEVDRRAREASSSPKSSNNKSDGDDDDVNESTAQDSTMSAAAAEDVERCCANPAQASDAAASDALAHKLRSAPADKAAVMGTLQSIDQSGPWVYNLFRRNCEHFALLCTAPTRQHGSQQVMMWRYNPLATIVIGVLIRLNHFRKSAEQDARVQRTVARYRRWKENTRSGQAITGRFRLARQRLAKYRYRACLYRRRVRWRTASLRKLVEPSASANRTERTP